MSQTLAPGKTLSGVVQHLTVRLEGAQRQGIRGTGTAAQAHSYVETGKLKTDPSAGGIS